jgi:hypothetical protein
MDLKKHLIIWLCFLAAGDGFGQFSDTIHYRINYTSTGNYNRTNTARSFLLNNTINLSYRKKSVAVNFSNKWLHGKQQSVVVNNDFSSLLDVNLYKTFKHFYYWGLSNYIKSYSLRINNQLQAGVGVAYNLIDRTNIKFNLSEGIIYDYSDVFIRDTVREIYYTPRNSFRVQIRYYYKSFFTFAGAFYVQNSLKYRKDVIYKGEVDMGIRIRKWLSLTSKLVYNRMDRTQRENLFITYGLTIDKYF